MGQADLLLECGDMAMVFGVWYLVFACIGNILFYTSMSVSSMYFLQAFSP